MYVEDGDIRFSANNNGGVLGGISNGMPITFRVAVKPTSSIRKEENTVDLRSMTNSTTTTHSNNCQGDEDIDRLASGIKAALERAQYVETMSRFLPVQGTRS